MARFKNFYILNSSLTLNLLNFLALQILYAIGWVHRDVSPGNILAMKIGDSKIWSVKLADFEFARPMIDKERKVETDPRTVNHVHPFLAFH